MAEYKRLHPMSEKVELAIEEEDADIFKETWIHDPEKNGKWILNYPVELINEKWKEAVTLYKARELTGIQYLKCSTGAPNPRVEKGSFGAMRFHCGPHNDRKSMLSYGKNLVEKMKYCSQLGYIEYHTDDKTTKLFKGIRVPRKSLLRVSVPTFDVVQPSLTTESGLPSKLGKTEHLTRRINAIARQFPREPFKLGKWIMVVDKRSIDQYWTKAFTLYKDRQLPGIAYIKASLGMKDYKTGLIKFFCGPQDDMKLMKSYGRTLVEKMEYKSIDGQILFHTYEKREDSIYSCFLPVPKSRNVM